MRKPQNEAGTRVAFRPESINGEGERLLEPFLTDCSVMTCDHKCDFELDL